jgi:hypothetical protein
METGIQRTGLDLEHLFRGPLNVFGDSVAVRGSRKLRGVAPPSSRALVRFNARDVGSGRHAISSMDLRHLAHF